MAMVGSIAIGMTVDTAKLKAGIDKGSVMLQGFATQAKGLGGTIAAVFSGIVAVKAVEGLGKMINAASDLSENMNKVDAIFGSGSKTVVAAADEMASAFGTSKNEFLDASGKLGGLLKGAGFAQGAAADLAVQFTKLSGDASSFYNLPFDVAFAKIRSGISGESEPLKDLGILMTEDGVKAKAMAMGLVKGGEELSNNAKVTARMAIISQGLADAQGDLAKTAGGVANSSRGLMGRFENLSASIGSVLLPITQQALAGMNNFAKGITDFTESSKPQFTAFIDTAVGVFDTFTTGASGVLGKLAEFPSAIGNSLGGGTTSMLSEFAASVKSFVLDKIDMIGFAWRNLPALFEVATLQIYEKILNVGEYLATIPANLSVIGDYIANNWAKMVSDAVNFVGTAFSNLGSNLANLGSAITSFLQDPTQGFKFEWKGLLDGFTATADKLPELIKPSLTSLQKEIDSKLAGIASSEINRAGRLAGDVAARAQSMAGSSGAAKAAALVTQDSAKVPKEIKFASAMAAGSKEAANTLLRSRYGAGLTNKESAKQTSLQTQMAKSLDKIATKVTNGGGGAQLVEDF